MTAKKILTDVCAIRLILIILLVLYHAFAIFCGGWTPLDGYPTPEELLQFPFTYVFLSD